MNKELVCKENHRAFRLDTNGAIFLKIKLDDGQDDENKKCDYLIAKDTKDIQIFVELKGNKVAKAFKQIFTSYENRDYIKNLQVSYYAAIVCSKFPQRDTTIQNLQRKANKIFKNIFIKNNEIQTRYENNIILQVN